MNRLDAIQSKLRELIPMLPASKSAEIEKFLAEDDLSGIAGEIYLALCRNHSALLNGPDWKRVVNVTIAPLIKRELAKISGRVE